MRDPRSTISRMNPTGNLKPASHGFPLPARLQAWAYPRWRCACSISTRAPEDAGDSAGEKDELGENAEQERQKLRRRTHKGTEKARGEFVADLLIREGGG